MVEETPTASETSVTMHQPTEHVTVVDGTLNLDKYGSTDNATAESAATSACLFVLCLLVEDNPYFWTDDRQSVFPSWR